MPLLLDFTEMGTAVYSNAKRYTGICTVSTNNPYDAGRMPAKQRTRRRPSVNALQPRSTPRGLGARLRSAPEQAGISLRELARRIGVSASLVSQIERGSVKPSVGT